MHLFQTLKRVDVLNFEKIAFERLNDVGLKESGHQKVGTFSGGMKRRMSLALSTMGNPNLILLDEPTTGMDPVNRRHVWTLLQRLKSDKSMIMTTHSMEEAELLSDKIILLEHGEVKCVGQPLELKKSIGKGYRVTMICQKKDVGQVKALMKMVVPSSNFLEQSGDSGDLVFSVPTKNVKELGSIFGLMENKKQNKQIK